MTKNKFKSKTILENLDGFTEIQSYAFNRKVPPDIKSRGKKIQ